MSRSLVKNTTYLLTALVGQKLIAFVYFSILARALGVYAIGLYTTALSFGLIFSIVVDVGLTSVLIRELAARRAHADELDAHASSLITHVLFIKIICAVFGYAILQLTVHAMRYPRELTDLVWIAGVTMVLDAFHLTLYGVLRAYEQLKYESYGMVAGQAITLATGAVLLAYHAPLPWFAGALSLGSACNVLWSAWMLKRLHAFRLFIAIHPPTIQFLLRAAMPFALAGILVKTYSFIDSVLLSKLSGAAAVGLYSIPYKLTSAFQFIPLALVASLYPAMSKAFARKDDSLKHLFEQSMKYLALAVCFLAAVFIALGGRILGTVYGAAYLPGAAALNVLAISVAFVFLGFPPGSLLNSTGRQHIQTALIGMNAVVNVACNIALIPRMGILGAAIASLAGNAFLTLGGVVCTVPVIHAPSQKWYGALAKIAASGYAAGALMRYSDRVRMPQLLRGAWGDYAHLGGSALMGALAFLACIYVLQVVGKDELAELSALFRRRAIQPDPSGE